MMRLSAGFDSSGFDKIKKSGELTSQGARYLGNEKTAEDGVIKLKEAIATFEAVKAADELGSAEYRALGDWYQAENRRDDYEKSKEQIYKTMPEGEIEQFLILAAKAAITS